MNDEGQWKSRPLVEVPRNWRCEYQSCFFGQLDSDIRRREDKRVLRMRIAVYENPVSETEVVYLRMRVEQLEGHFIDHNLMVPEHICPSQRVPSHT